MRRDVHMASPLRPPPPGVASEFDRSDFVAMPVVVTAGVCLPLIFACAFARLLARVLARKWTRQDYLFCFTLVVGVAFVAYSIPLTSAEPYGYHIWDIDTRRLTKSWMLRFHTFAIFTGPVLWISKTMVIAHLVHVFTSVRWFKNCGRIIVPTTGMVYALYTCTASIVCAPRPDSELESYINGFQQKTCSGEGGVNMAVGIIMALINALADLYLVIATFMISPSLRVTIKERRVIYLIHFVGIIASACSLVGLAYRIKTFREVDLTGYQIPINTALVLEVSISLMIPCMSSFYAVYRHYTYVEINERTTIGTPSTRLHSTLSHHGTNSGHPSQRSSQAPTPLSHIREPPKSWRKAHLSIEELPFRKTSVEFYRNSPQPFRSERDSRMKALPPTPLPLMSRNNSVADGTSHPPNVPRSPKTPKTPKTPNSVRSMRLPIWFERPRH